MEVQKTWSEKQLKKVKKKKMKKLLSENRGKKINRRKMVHQCKNCSWRIGVINVEAKKQLKKITLTKKLLPKNQVKNGMLKKKGKKGSTWMEKLETNHLLWEHNLSHTLPPSIEPHTFVLHDFTDKLQEWSRMLKPGRTCLFSLELLCYYATKCHTSDMTCPTMCGGNKA